MISNYHTITNTVDDSAFSALTRHRFTGRTCAGALRPSPARLAPRMPHRQAVRREGSHGELHLALLGQLAHSDSPPVLGPSQEVATAQHQLVAACPTPG